MPPLDNGFLQRLENSFNTQEKEFQKTRDDVFSLKGQQSVIQRDITTLTTTVNALIAKMDERAKPNWTAIALAVTMFVAVVPGMGFVMTTYVSAALSPITNITAINAADIKHSQESLHYLDAASASSQAADVNSRTDRQQLNDRTRLLETAVQSEIADRRSMQAALKVSLAEIETQFHALSNMDNLRIAEQDRTNSIIWEKTFPGQRYPNGTFFPGSIFQNGQTASGSTP